MKAKTIQIKSTEESLADFARAYHAAAERKPFKKQRGTFFASIAAARRVLTTERIQLLKSIKQHKPHSLYELAKLTHRDFKNVSQDVSFLSELGLIELGRPHGTRHQRRPTLLSDHIYLELAI